MYKLRLRMQYTGFVPKAYKHEGGNSSSPGSPESFPKKQPTLRKALCLLEEFKKDTLRNQEP